MGECIKNQNILLGTPDTLHEQMEHNILLAEDARSILIMKQASGLLSEVCSVDITDKAAGFQIGVDGSSVFFTVTDPIPEENIGPVLSMTAGDSPYVGIQPEGTSAFFVGFEDIRIGRATLKFDGKCKFNIRYESATERIYIEMHKHMPPS